MTNRLFNTRSQRWFVERVDKLIDQDVRHPQSRGETASSAAFPCFISQSDLVQAAKYAVGDCHEVRLGRGGVVRIQTSDAAIERLIRILVRLLTT